MILLIWILNFIISGLNAWGCGKSWNETRYRRGFPHLVNWSAAIMAAAGFTWCYLVLAVFFGATVPFEQSDGTEATYLTMDEVQAVADLGYLLVIFPIVGSGLVLTVHAWSAAFQRRTLASGSVAAWDTFAMVYNVSQAFSNVPLAAGRLGGFFSDRDRSNDSKGKVVLLVVFCAFAGIITTYLIVTRTARSTAQSRAWRYQACSQADKLPFGTSWRST